MEFKVFVDDTCKECAKAVAQVAKLERTRRKGVYGTKFLKTGTFVQGFVLRPDYNSAGVVTHWHLEREKVLAKEGV